MIIYIKFNEQKSAKAIPMGEAQYLDVSESGRAGDYIAEDGNGRSFESN
jgi:predicted RNA-binding protein with TRAM domain